MSGIADFELGSRELVERYAKPVLRIYLSAHLFWLLNNGSLGRKSVNFSVGKFVSSASKQSNK